MRVPVAEAPNDIRQRKPDGHKLGCNGRTELRVRYIEGRYHVVDRCVCGVASRFMNKFETIAAARAWVDRRS